MHPGLLGRRQIGEAAAQRVARQGVHAHPLAASAAAKTGVSRARRASRSAASARPVDGPAQVGVQVIEDGDARQECEIDRIEIGQQHRCELLAQHAAACAASAATSARGSSPRHHRQRELQAERPALGEFVQAGGGVDVDRGTEAAPHQGDRLVEPEAQHDGRRTMHWP